MLGEAVGALLVCGSLACAGAAFLRRHNQVATLLLAAALAAAAADAFGAQLQSVACALGYLDFRHAERDWRALHPGLAAWHTAFAARPALLATAPGA